MPWAPTGTKSRSPLRCHASRRSLPDPGGKVRSTGIVRLPGEKPQGEPEPRERRSWRRAANGCRCGDAPWTNVVAGCPHARKTHRYGSALHPRTRVRRIHCPSLRPIHASRRSLARRAPTTGKKPQKLNRERRARQRQTLPCQSASRRKSSTLLRQFGVSCRYSWRSPLRVC